MGRLMRAGVLFLTVASLAPAGIEGQEISLPLGTQAPPAGLEDLDGSPVNLLEYVEAGKPTLSSSGHPGARTAKPSNPSWTRYTRIGAVR